MIPVGYVELGTFPADDVGRLVDVLASLAPPGAYICLEHGDGCEAPDDPDAECTCERITVLLPVGQAAAR